MDFHKNLIDEYAHEVETTRKVLNAIPDSADFSYKPSEKSMAFGRLAGHLVEMFGAWAKLTLVQDELAMDPNYKPWIPATKSQLLERLDAGVAEVKAALAGFNPADWERTWKLTSGGQVFIEQSKYMTWRTVVMNHAIHHRGQFSVYLRHFGAKLPGIYGPSADGM